MLDDQIGFLIEADKLNTILRRNYTVAGDRRENSAEHSWHVALTAMVLAEHSNEPVKIDRVVRMLLVHDIVEIDAGDTFIYDSLANTSKEAREQEAAKRLFSLLPKPQPSELRALWLSEDPIPEALHCLADAGQLAIHNSNKTERR